MQMGKKNSTGTFTQLYVKMLKITDDKKMHAPFEVNIWLPKEVVNPNASNADLNSKSLAKST